MAKLFEAKFSFLTKMKNEAITILNATVHWVTEESKDLMAVQFRSLALTSNKKYAKL